LMSPTLPPIKKAVIEIFPISFNCTVSAPCQSRQICRSLVWIFLHW
jgi:hypothetical protein